MQELDEITLLRQFAETRSEAAFEELFSRRGGFVYSSALRQVRDPQLAVEITQAVFIILARKAGRITDKTSLSGWLFKTTRFVALAQIRADSKRRQCEQESQMHTQPQIEPPSVLTENAWTELSPLLDEALAGLREADRQAILLRFFENKSLAEIGNTLGTGEDTAGKRVSRALEKLRKYFAKRRIFFTAPIIAGAIAANSVHAAPVGLAATIPAVAVKGSAISVSTLTLVKESLKLMKIGQLKMAALIAAAAILTTGSTIVVSEVVAQSNDDSAQVSDAEWTNMTAQTLLTFRPVLILRSTHFGLGRQQAGGRAGGQYGIGMIVRGGKMLGRDVSFETLMAAAYDTPLLRVVPPSDEPAGDFDILMSGSQASKERVQDEIKAQLHYTAHTELRPTDVLVLTLKINGAPGLKPSQPQQGTSRGISGSSSSTPTGSRKIMNFPNQAFTNIVKNLQLSFDKPILDRTGLTGSFDASLDISYPRGTSAGDAIMQALPDQLGLELTPRQEPMDVLVIEKVK